MAYFKIKIVERMYEGKPHKITISASHDVADGIVELLDQYFHIEMITAKRTSNAEEHKIIITVDDRSKVKRIRNAALKTYFNLEKQTN